MPVGLRNIQPWHSTIFLRMEGFAFRLSERADVAESIVPAVQDELTELFTLFERTQNQFKGS